MELKIKDFEKFKAYYCGLCLAIKKNYGNIPRTVLNYDMTFLAILLDSFKQEKSNIKFHRCALHPTKKKLIIKDNEALDYAAFCNVILTYFKLLDNIKDDNSFTSKGAAFFLKTYTKNALNDKYKDVAAYVDKSISELSKLENSENAHTIDEIAHPFADLTGFLLSAYFTHNKLINSDEVFTLYWLGYNLGKWIYIIDAFDDLEKDMQKHKFNVLNKVLNTSNLDFNSFSKSIEERIDNILTDCACNCLGNLNSLSIIKNIDILNNILQYGLMEKIDKVFKRSVNEYE
jgi:hypothetical protein